MVAVITTHMIFALLGFRFCFFFLRFNADRSPISLWFTSHTSALKDHSVRSLPIIILRIDPKVNIWHMALAFANPL